MLGIAQYRPIVGMEFFDYVSPLKKVDLVLKHTRKISRKEKLCSKSDRNIYYVLICTIQVKRQVSVRAVYIYQNNV